MKKFSFNSRKFRYGGVTAALTALVIVIVIVANIAISTLASYLNWYTFSPSRMNVRTLSQTATTSLTPPLP